MNCFHFEHNMTTEQAEQANELVGDKFILYLFRKGNSFIFNETFTRR